VDRGLIALRLGTLPVLRRLGLRRRTPKAIYRALRGGGGRLMGNGKPLVG